MAHSFSFSLFHAVDSFNPFSVNETRVPSLFFFGSLSGDSIEMLTSSLSPLT